MRHVGGHPSFPQQAIIERAAWLALQCAMLDSKLAEGRFTEQDSKVYLAWTNTLSRLLARLGIEPAPEAAPTFEQAMANIHALASRRAEPDDDEPDEAA